MGIVENCAPIPRTLTHQFKVDERGWTSLATPVTSSSFLSDRPHAANPKLASGVSARTRIPHRARSVRLLPNRVDEAPRPFHRLKNEIGWQGTHLRAFVRLPRPSFLKLELPRRPNTMDRKPGIVPLWSQGDCVARTSRPFRRS